GSIPSKDAVVPREGRALIRSPVPLPGNGTPRAEILQQLLCHARIWGASRTIASAPLSHHFCSCPPLGQAGAYPPTAATDLSRPLVALVPVKLGNVYQVCLE